MECGTGCARQSYTKNGITAFYCTCANPSDRAIAIGASDGGELKFSTPLTLIEEGDTAYHLYSQVTFRFHNILLGIVMVCHETSAEGRIHCRPSWWNATGDETHSADNWQWVDTGQRWSHMQGLSPAGAGWELRLTRLLRSALHSNENRTGLAQITRLGPAL